MDEVIISGPIQPIRSDSTRTLSRPAPSYKTQYSRRRGLPPTPFVSLQAKDTLPCQGTRFVCTVSVLNSKCMENVTKSIHIKSCRKLQLFSLAIICGQGRPAYGGPKEA